MKTLILKVDENTPYNNIEQINKAADIIKNGGLVAFPTETVYGLGADGLNKRAVKSIYEAKGRPSDNPLILHISSLDEINGLVGEIPEKALPLMEKFWPGPLTLIFKKSEAVPYETTGNLDTVAIRFPVNKIARLLIRQSGVPIAAPSANTSGKPSPTRASHVEFDLNGKIEMILDGGACEYGIESTILDVSTKTPCLLRPGSITKEEIEKEIGPIDVDKAVYAKIGADEKPKAPGMKYTHYSPLATVKIVRGDREKMTAKINELALLAKSEGKKVGILATEENKDKYPNFDVLVLGSVKDGKQIASNVFKMLRKSDSRGFDTVLCEGFPDKGLWLSVMNRLRKAAGNDITEV